MRKTAAPKMILASKTILLSFVVVLTYVLQQAWGWVIPPEVQLALVGVAMFVLRLVTKGPVRFRVSGEVPVMGPFVPEAKPVRPTAAQIPKSPPKDV